MVLLCANARKYNQESSQIYQDSLELEKGFVAAQAVVGEVVAEADSEDEDVGGGASQPSSSVHVVEVESYASDNSDGMAAQIAS